MGDFTDERLAEVEHEAALDMEAGCRNTHPETVLSMCQRIREQKARAEAAETDLVDVETQVSKAEATIREKDAEIERVHGLVRDMLSMRATTPDQYREWCGAWGIDHG